MPIFHPGREKSFCIKSPKSNTWPTNVGAFVAIGDYRQPESRALPPDMVGWREGKLVGWELCVWSQHKGNHHNNLWLNDSSAEQFWQSIIHWARCNGTVWLWGWNVWPAWCLLGGVQEIDQGRLILDISQQSDSKALPGKRPHRSQGLFVAENPPTIICLAVPGGGRIKIVDLANYGITPEAYRIEGDSGRLAATVQAVKDYHRLCQVYDLGSCQTTAASQAWYCYRRSHMVHPIIVHPMQKVLELEQAAYYGGRCECVRIGRFREKLYHLDVNSMYTSLGLIQNFPHRYHSTWTPVEEGDLPPVVPGTMSIADVTLVSGFPYYPARERVKESPDGSPIGRTGRERVIYPVGVFRTALADPELALASLNGCIWAYHRVQYYDAQPIMAQWSRMALTMRQSLKTHGFDHLAQAAKKIMNSLPGKWGQRLKTWVDFPSGMTAGYNPSEPDQWFQEWGKHPTTGEITPYRTIARQCQYQDREQLSQTSCPAIAATWTAAGRVFLLGAVIQCGWENVYYYDTDSLILNEQGYQSMVVAGVVHPKQPGAWKLKEESDDVEILGIRRYRFGPRWCVAGPFGGQVVGEGLPPKWSEHEPFNSQLWHRSVGDAVEVRRHARWRKEYHHGIVQDDGKVLPFACPGTGQLGAKTIRLG